MRPMQKPLILPLVLAACAASLALHSACASSPDAPAEYRQGVYRPPPPPALRPGHGAPTYSPHLQPDTQVEPQARPAPVPHTARTQREDTIWSAEPTKAVTPSEDPKILGVLLPFGEGLNTPDEQVHTYECASLMGAAAKRVPGATQLPRSMRQCVAALQYVTCMKWIATRDNAAEAVGVPFPPGSGDRVLATGRTALRFLSVMCPNGMDTRPDVMDWANKITEEANKATRSNVQ